MASLIFIAALLVQQGPLLGPDQVEQVTVEATSHAPKAPGPIPDADIERQLNDLLVKEPDRVVCLYKTPTGTRIPRPLCHTLSGWYNFEAARNTSAMRGGAGGIRPPPYELVRLIKSRMSNPKTRAMAEARAGARLEAEARARADGP